MRHAAPFSAACLDSVFLVRALCRWEALEVAFKEIVEAGGDMVEYRRRWEEGRWWWLSGASDTVFAGPDKNMTCRQARAQGIID